MILQEKMKKDFCLQHIDCLQYTSNFKNTANQISEKSNFVTHTAFMELRMHKNDQSCYHIETSQLICPANQLTGYYMMATLATIFMSLVLK